MFEVTCQSNTIVRHVRLVPEDSDAILVLVGIVLQQFLSRHLTSAFWKAGSSGARDLHEGNAHHAQAYNQDTLPFGRHCRDLLG